MRKITIFWVDSTTQTMNIEYEPELHIDCTSLRDLWSILISGQIVKSEQGERFPLPSLFPFPFSLPLPSPPFPLPLPSLPLEVGPLNQAKGSGGALKAPPAGSGGRAPAKIEFDAF